MRHIFSTAVGFNHFNSSEVLTQLQENGYAVVEDFLKKRTIEKLTDEFQFLFSLASQVGTKRSVSNGDYGLCPFELIDEYKDRCNTTFDFLNYEPLMKVGEDYFNIKSNLKINNHVEFEINSSKGASTASLPHFDRMPALKMIIYLTDVSETSGATYVYPRTYTEIRHHIFKSLSNVADIHELKNFVLEKEISVERVTVECRKGTLIIVDTAGLHGGGNMGEENINRKVIRGLTWYLPESFKNLSNSALPINDEMFSNNGSQIKIPTDSFITYAQKS